MPCPALCWVRNSSLYAFKAVRFFKLKLGRKWQIAILFFINVIIGMQGQRRSIRAAGRRNISLRVGCFYFIFAYVVLATFRRTVNYFVLQYNDKVLQYSKRVKLLVNVIQRLLKERYKFNCSKCQSLVMF